MSQDEQKQPTARIRLQKARDRGTVPAKVDLKEEIKRISDLQLTLSKRVAQLADALSDK